jgi:PEP-CTERM motif
MMKRNIAKKERAMKMILLVVAVLFLAVVPSAFATATYTDETAFLTSIAPVFYLEDFSGWSSGNPIPNQTGPITDADFGPNYGYSWHAHTPEGSLFSNSSALSTGFADDTSIMITFTGAPVTAVGGIFSFTDPGENISNYAITVALNDGTTVVANGSSFIGFTSNVPLTSLLFTTASTPELDWPQLDHLYLGTASSTTPPTTVPEPSTFALLAAGLGGMALLRKRR